MNRRLPARYRDILPAPLPPLPPISQPQLHVPLPSLPRSPGASSPSTQPAVHNRSRGQGIRTPPNIYGLVRQYSSDAVPNHDPEEYVRIQDLTDEPSFEAASAPIAPIPHPNSESYSPYPNQSSFLLGDWYWSHGTQKSRESFTQLMRIVSHPEFRPEDVRRVNWEKINSSLGSNPFDYADKGEWMDEDSGWHRTPISISVPFHSKSKVPGPKDYYVGDFYHRSLVDVIREKLASPVDVQHFHYEPFQLFWDPNGTSPDMRVHGEMYTSPAFLDAHRELQDSPREPGCNLPRVVVGMMFWSDVTHLTSFGNAKLWPCYLYFGNESKYRRCKPNCNLCNHVAYFQAVSRVYFSCSFFADTSSPQLPDAFKDFATQHGGRAPSKALVTHCRRELLHAQWKVLLDDKFIEAYQHGIVVECCDKIARRFHPRFLTYSADYKEKCVFLVSLSCLAVLTNGM